MKIELSGSVVSQAIDDDLVLLDPSTETFYRLDDVGFSFWSAIEKHENFNCIADALANEFSVSRDDIRNDLQAFTKKLEELGLCSIRTIQE